MLCRDDGSLDGLYCLWVSARLLQRRQDLIHGPNRRWRVASARPSGASVALAPVASHGAGTPRGSWGRLRTRQLHLLTLPISPARSPDGAVLVGAVVVEDEMNVERSGDALVHVVQEREEFLMAMPSLALREDLAVGDVERREEGRRAVAGVRATASQAAPCPRNSSISFSEKPRSCACLMKRRRLTASSPYWR